RNAEDERESNQYVQVTVAQSIVYKELDPKSDILLRVKKGEFLELDSEGKHWIRVRVKDEIGWLAKDDVRFFCLCSAEN
ncbi:MAG: SH3 domain-containing protein, partial [Chitinispirillaceae bacterium]